LLNGVKQVNFSIAQLAIQLIMAFLVPFLSVFGGGYVFDHLRPRISGFDDGVYSGSHGSHPPSETSFNGTTMA